jgi:hypothetical protein
MSTGAIKSALFVSLPSALRENDSRAGGDFITDRLIFLENGAWLMMSAMSRQNCPETCFY